MNKKAKRNMGQTKTSTDAQLKSSGKKQKLDTGIMETIKNQEFQFSRVI